ncbi:hypothetical protein Ancab_032367 [Ancistrocladus abbreviatus]
MAGTRWRSYLLSSRRRLDQIKRRCSLETNMLSFPRSSALLLLFSPCSPPSFSSHNNNHRFIPRTQFQKSPLLLQPPLTHQHTSTHQPNSMPLQKKDEYSDSETSLIHSPPNMTTSSGDHEAADLSSSKHELQSTSFHVNKQEVFHDKDVFLEDYQEMNRSLKIYVYPHRRNDPFANILLPVDKEPGGNYASETYFKNVLMKSHFITKDPSKADLFFRPFSIAGLRNDRRIGVAGLQGFIRDYIFNISQKYPYWNRTGGADHFYIACHSVGRLAMDKEEQVKLNAIQVVCSSSYFLPNYVTHKDASLPQIWPRHGSQDAVPSKRKRLAFFAGAMNSPVRQKVLRVWDKDPEIFAHKGRLKTPYADELLGSNFCLHLKGFEVNTARIGDSLYYGCIPVIIADYYDLPFMDTLNWKAFSVVVNTLDIPSLKQILKGLSSDELSTLQENVMKVRKHFQWNPIRLIMMLSIWSCMSCGSDEVSQS